MEIINRIIIGIEDDESKDSREEVIEFGENRKIPLDIVLTAIENAVGGSDVESASEGSKKDKMKSRNNRRGIQAKSSDSSRYAQKTIVGGEYITEKSMPDIRNGNIIITRKSKASRSSWTTKHVSVERMQTIRNRSQRIENHINNLEKNLQEMDLLL